MFKVKAIQPRYNGVLTTAHVYSEDVRSESGLYLGTTKMAGSMNPYQTVVAVGPMARDLEPGKIVKINFKRYLVPLHLPGKIEDNVQKDNMNASYEIPCIELDGKTYLMIQDNDIEYVVTDYELDNDGGLLE